MTNEEYINSLPEDERKELLKRLAQVKRETRQFLRERKPESVRIAYGTSTPGYYAMLETETKV